MAEQDCQDCQETLGTPGNVVVSQDEATIAQVERIQKEIAGSCELVGGIEDLSSLEEEYASDDCVYQAKIKDLKAKYSKLRRTRGDGNCFFRAFGFGYMEALLLDGSEAPRFIERVEKIRDVLLGLGYPSFTLEDFHDTFVDVVESTVKPEATHAALLQKFQDQGTSDYIVCYLRLLTSAHLQSKAEFFQCFMEGGCSVQEFCNKEVEPMYIECDHVHITALTQALGVGVRVQYMDRGKGAHVNHHDFPDGCQPRVHILYRPGHYDILYSM